MEHQRRRMVTPECARREESATEQTERYLSPTRAENNIFAVCLKAWTKSFSSVGVRRLRPERSHSVAGMIGSRERKSALIVVLGTLAILESVGFWKKLKPPLNPGVVFAHLGKVFQYLRVTIWCNLYIRYIMHGPVFFLLGSAAMRQCVVRSGCGKVFI